MALPRFIPDGADTVNTLELYENWSADDVALVSPEVVTVTSTVPEDSAGAVAVIWVLLLTVYDVAGVPPKFTALAPVNPVPVTVTTVPPPVDPDDGDTPVTEGRYVN
jgi:hypothetical protein